MEAIILAGGFGTRLQHVVSDVPKPMAPINKIPFLQYIFEYLLKNNISKVILAVGYKSEIIIDYFGDKYKEIDILYSNEYTPLFTGGAIKKALNLCENKNIFIINGDTYFDVDLSNMFNFHRESNSDLTIAVKEMLNFSRYGTVEFSDTKVIKFNEKKSKEIGFINGGIYIINRDILDMVDLEKFSFEKDFMEKYINKADIRAFKSNGYFIDIGIPEDYYKAQKQINKL